MGNTTIQPTFTSGEITPSLYGRVDGAWYYKGLKTCRNFIVRQFGGVSNRTGSVYVDDVDSHSVKHRLIPFQFSTLQTYVLVLGNQTMRVIKDGGTVLDSDTEAIVSVATPWLEADLFDLVYSQSADTLTVTHKDYPPYQITRTDHDAWTVAAFESTSGPFSDINIDATKTLKSSGVSGTVTLTSDVDMFTANMVDELFYMEQSASATTNIKRWEVGKAVIVNDVRRAGSNYYQAITSGTTGTVRPSTMEGIEADGDPGVQWLYLHNGTGIAKITVYTSAKVVTAVVQSRLPDSMVTTSQVRSITGAVASDPDTVAMSGDEYVTVTCSAHGFQSGDSVTFASVGGMTELTGVLQVIVIDANTLRVNIEATHAYTSGGTATKALTAIKSYKWAKAAYGIDNGYPACNSYYQQRKLFGGGTSEPQTTRASKTAGYVDFGTSVPMLDDDAISHTIASREVNAIQHFVELNSLVVLTSNGPWIMKGGTNDVITPASISIKRQGYGGASAVMPVVIGSRALYVQDKGNQVRSLGYNFGNDAFDGTDLTVISNHLFGNRRLIDWAYQAVPFSCVWAVRDDGVLLGLTYMPEQEVLGWHHHDTDGLYESVACISEGNEDAVYVVVNRTIGGVTKRYIERFASRLFDDLADGVFLDSALSYDGRQTATITLTGGSTWNEETVTATSSSAVNVNGGAMFVAGDVGNEIHITDDNHNVYRLRITAYTSATQVSVYLPSTLPAGFRATAASWALAKDEFSGLSHLEGKSVSGCVDGRVVDPMTVSGGAVTIDYPGAVVHIGLPYDCDLETLSINVSGRNLLDKQKLIGRVNVMCQETVGLSAGPDADHLDPYRQRDTENYDQAVQPVSAIAEVEIATTWNTSGQVFIRQSNPLPITVLAIMPDVSIGG